MLKTFRMAVWGFAVACLVACGGGGGGADSSGSTGSTGSSSGSSGGGSGGTSTAPTNVLPLTVDAGPLPSSLGVINGLFASVTVCTPGSTTACQTIDHVLVDTGSVGLRLITSVLNGTVQPQHITAGSGNVIYECTQFADGYAWGAMATLDVQLGSRALSGLPVNLIGDSPGGLTPPTDCTQGLAAENTGTTFGANGVLGIGAYLQDCGGACAPGTGSIPSGTYYTCPSSVCSLTTVALAQQTANPVAALASDHNGLVIVLPQASASGNATLSGTLYFGIGTQTNNGLGSAQLMTLDGYGDVQTTFGTSVITQSFIDTGSNAYYFDSSLALCKTNTDFYCPTSNGAPTTQTEQAQIQGQNTGVVKSVSFTVSNADSLLQTAINADPGLAGPATASGNGTFKNYFDWGLPFFFGRSVYVLFENATLGAVQGPANGF
jgi:Protein of unknown function (DUF3443)